MLLGPTRLSLSTSTHVHNTKQKHPLHTLLPTSLAPQAGARHPHPLRDRAIIGNVLSLYVPLTASSSHRPHQQRQRHAIRVEDLARRRRANGRQDDVHTRPGAQTKGNQLKQQPKAAQLWRLRAPRCKCQFYKKKEKNQFEINQILFF